MHSGAHGSKPFSCAVSPSQPVAYLFTARVGGDSGGGDDGDHNKFSHLGAQNSTEQRRKDTERERE